MDEHEKRVDLGSELGVSRRDLLRRGAIVGGTLLWVAPAIQSMAPKAFAAGPSPGGCAACYCWNTRPNGRLAGDVALHGGIRPGGLLDSRDCATFCTDRGFANSVYCSGSSGCEAIARSDLDGTLPADTNPPCTEPNTKIRQTGPNPNYGVLCCSTLG